MHGAAGPGIHAAEHPMTTLSPNSPTAPGLVTPDALREWLDADAAAVVDVRDPEEFAREHIPGAHLVPLARISPDALPAAGRTVLHCKSGRRSAEAAARLAAAGRTDILQLAGGLDAWKQAGLPVEANPRVPISIMRQVQIVAGTITFVGTILAASVSPWFLILPGFIGMGLAFAGASGTCGMAAMLRVMPWNRPFAGASCPSDRAT
jgi:rhodanese-related sulfurtransferase